MGRSLFSQKYSGSPAVTVRTEPEPTAESYETWSRWNYFDPDSDEFFQNAQREVFTDTEEYRLEQEEVRAMVAAGGVGSSASSETGESDRSSPMAVGPDDPAVLISDAFSTVDWEHRFLIAGAAEADWLSREDRQLHDSVGPPRVTSLFSPRGPRTDSTEATEHVRAIRANRPRSATVSSGPVFLPPSSLRNSTTAVEIGTQSSYVAPQTPPARRTINITPIDIPIEPSTPSPISPGSPFTPIDTLYSRETQAMLTPSPAPSVTPHVYTWNRRVLVVPSSPLVMQGAGGPLTNPNARLSLARIRIQNAAV